MNNQTEVSIKFRNSITKEKALEKYAETLSKISATLKGIDKGTLTQIEKSSQSLKNVDKNIGNINKDADKLKSKLNLAFNVAAIKVFANALGRTYNTLVKLTNKSADYLENINLFSVAFKEQGKAVEETTAKAQKFTNSLVEMYGLDESWVTQTTGKFKQLANAMGLGNETGTKLSKLLTQMSLDISSLYNADFSKSSSVLQSSLAGQTKPIRGLAGGDITQATLQTTLDDMDIDRKISDLTFAEKRLVIIISLTKQLSESIGDMGRTIESPANQMRVLNSQWERLTRTVGNIFMPIISKILPIVNAILMVMTEIASIIAKLFGFTEKDAVGYASGISDEIDDIVGGIEDAGDGLDSAAESANKLKRGLRGFDKLNNITTPTPTSSGSSISAGAGGISPDLLDKFNKAYDDYFAKLDKTKMKATEIRDKIMEWLGFTKEIDKETGKVSFKFDHITGGTVLGALAVGGSIFLGVAGILGMVSKIGSATGITQGIGTLATIFSSSTVGIILGVAAAIGVVAYSLYDLYQKNEEFAKEFDEEWANIKKALEPIKDELKELFETLTGDFDSSSINVLKDVFSELWSIIQVLSQEILEVLYPIIMEIIIPAFEDTIRIITDVIKIVNELWNTYGKPISEEIKAAIQNMEEIFQTLWVQFIKPIVDKVKKIIDDLWETTLKPMFKKVGEVIGELSLLLLTLYNNVIAPIVKWLINTMYPIIETVVSYILDIVHNLFKTLGGVINGILDIFKGVIQFLTGVFSGNWKKALEGLVNIGKGVFNTFASIVEGIINSIIKGLNFSIKSIYNGIKSLVNKIGGVVNSISKALGLNINMTMSGQAPQLDFVTIPRLEKGMDFVPKDYYGPVYLDYGERVLTKQENKDYAANSTAGDNASNKPINNTFNIHVGSEKIASVVLKDLQDMAKSNGKPIEISA